MLARFFIDRPIFAWVLSIVIVLVGVVCNYILPIAQYPEIAPPTVQVTCVYPGASAKVVQDTVAEPIRYAPFGRNDFSLRLELYEDDALPACPSSG